MHNKKLTTFSCYTLLATFQIAYKAAKIEREADKLGKELFTLL